MKDHRNGNGSSRFGAVLRSSFLPEGGGGAEGAKAGQLPVARGRIELVGRVVDANFDLLLAATNDLERET